MDIGALFRIKQFLPARGGLLKSRGIDRMRTIPLRWSQRSQSYAPARRLLVPVKSLLRIKTRKIAYRALTIVSAPPNSFASHDVGGEREIQASGGELRNNVPAIWDHTHLSVQQPCRNKTFRCMLLLCAGRSICRLHADRGKRLCTEGREPASRVAPRRLSSVSLPSCSGKRDAGSALTDRAARESFADRPRLLPDRHSSFGRSIRIPLAGSCASHPVAHPG